MPYPMAYYTRADVNDTMQSHIHTQGITFFFFFQITLATSIFCSIISTCDTSSSPSSYTNKPYITNILLLWHRYHAIIVPFKNHLIQETIEFLWHFVFVYNSLYGIHTGYRFSVRTERKKKDEMIDFT